ncbi:MAG: DUF3140 domain-containing protein [Erythrobacter sp.]
MNQNERDEIYSTFYDRLNMEPKELEDWLETEESKSVGDSDEDESTGHKSGRRIIEIKRTNKDELTDDQFEHMNKVGNYIKRHLSQEPDGDVEETNWRYSLMNWGHDPLKDD